MFAPLIAKPRAKPAPSPDGRTNIRSATARAGAARAAGATPRYVQRKAAIGAEDHPAEQEADRVARRVTDGPGQARVGRNAMDPGGREAPASVHEALAATGEPLDPASRAYFEPRFGRDFGQVRIHAGPAAARSARDIGALAYTSGANIAFDTGRFAPGTRDGRLLLAHELAHVVQQTDGAPRSVRRQPAPD